MMTSCCKEKAVLVAVYEENPKKKRLISTRNNHTNTTSIKHHHHYHHHLQVHDRKTGNNRKSELLSYSKHLRESSKLIEPSTSDHRPKPLVSPATNEGQQLTTPGVDDPKKKRVLKKQPSCLDMNSMFKCFGMSQAANNKKKRKKRSSGGDHSLSSSSKKASVAMKSFNARTQKGARRFFKKLMAIIQKYR